MTNRESDNAERDMAAAAIDVIALARAIDPRQLTRDQVEKLRELLYGLWAAALDAEADPAEREALLSIWN